MKIRNYITQIVLGFFVLILLVVASAYGWFNKYVLIASILFILTFLIALTIMQFTTMFSKPEKQQRKNMLFEVFSNVNTLMQSMPGGDVLDWNYGRNVRIFHKTYKVGDDMKQYFAIVAKTLHNKKWVSVIYNKDEDIIEEFIGDPSPKKLINPFFDFNPMHSAYDFNTRQILNLIKKKGKTPSINIYAAKDNIEDRDLDLEDIDDKENLRKKAEEAMREARR